MLKLNHIHGKIEAKKFGGVRHRATTTTTGKPLLFPFLMAVFMVINII